MENYPIVHIRRCEAVGKLWKNSFDIAWFFYFAWSAGFFQVENLALFVEYLNYLPV
ncbi:hypothetical protein GSS88_05285 [Corynebacterium sp. 3HC-13]|uniref:hypothetical protein n=1 Tax=Corynebacterium poyangense TaxID=2684405 RepID=UPI001CC8F281|nr:hypothetical protein [Corynebacterium poyangense]MBZ8177211.1 hypothetical protein [Corynebacterium poyangense]